MFFQIFAFKVYKSAFWKNNNLWTVQLSLRNLQIFQLKSKFQRKENRFCNLALKTKKKKAIQLPKVVLNLVKNQFLLFLDFPDLGNIVIYSSVPNF